MSPGLSSLGRRQVELYPCRMSGRAPAHMAANTSVGERQLRLPALRALGRQGSAVLSAVERSSLPQMR
jgi:hypothetical protein